MGKIPGEVILALRKVVNVTVTEADCLRDEALGKLMLALAAGLISEEMCTKLNAMIRTAESIATLRSIITSIETGMYSTPAEEPTEDEDLEP